MATWHFDITMEALPVILQIALLLLLRGFEMPVGCRPNGRGGRHCYFAARILLLR